MIGRFTIIFLLSCFLQVRAPAPSFSRNFQSMLSTLFQSSINDGSVTCTATATSNNEGVQGTCRSAVKCGLSNRRRLGNCENSSGVCCVDEIRGTGTAKNPVTVNIPAALLLQSNLTTKPFDVFRFPKQQGVCGISIFFLQTRLASGGEDGNCVTDYVKVEGSPTLQSGSITVCGDLSGQHMHLSYLRGTLKGNNSAEIKMTVKRESGTGVYAINVLQVKCDDPELVPSDCLQMYKGDQGLVKSFGYPIQLNNQVYRICTRAAFEDAVSTTWKECSVGMDTKFFITGWPDLNGNPPAAVTGDLLCSGDHVYNNWLNPPGKHCGGSFPQITVPVDGGYLGVNFDGDESGYSAVISELAPSLQNCDFVVPGHTCRHPINGDVTTCICILNPEHVSFFNFTLEPNEICPTIKGYICGRDELGAENFCLCQEDYREYDQGNTGFCLEFTHNY